ncbi:MAG: Bax inhibitor-1/YccA family protein [Microthrixaceae bacterium]
MSRNPVLTDAAFGATSTNSGPSPADEWAAAQASTAAAAPDAAFAAAPPSIPTVTTGRTMSIGGVASATLVMFAVLLVGAWYGWTLVTETPILNPLPDGPTATATIDSPLIVFGALIAAFVLVLVSTFKPPLARFTGVLYAALEGVVLGAISHLYNAQFDGIVAQAIICTFGVFLAMMVLYGLRILRATPRFVKGVVAATFGIMLLYIGSMIWSIFFTTPSFMVSSSPLSIGISVIIVIVAAMNLILDFDFIEQGSKRGLPAHMDWYAALGLMVTLVWLYLEMLRLLAKLRQ